MKIGHYKMMHKHLVRPSRKENLKKIIDEAKATDPELFESLKDDPWRYIKVMMHKYDGTEKPKDYPRKITKIVKVEKPKPKPIEIDYDWRLAHWQDYPEDDDVKKLVSQPSVEASNAEWWENEYYEYKKMVARCRSRSLNK